MIVFINSVVQLPNYFAVLNLEMRKKRKKSIFLSHQKNKQKKKKQLLTDEHPTKSYYKRILFVNIVLGRESLMTSCERLPI